MWYWIIIPFILVFLGLFLWDYNKFSNRFKAQGKPASKLSEKEIERWKNKGLSGAESGQAYNNGWTDPNNPLIKKGKISFYSNHQQSDKNINPFRVGRTELDNFYKLLVNISQDNNSNLDYNNQISHLNYSKLPSWRQWKDLLRIYNERKYDNISSAIKKLETIEDIKKESPNINTLENYYLPNNKTKQELFKFQNNRLNEFLNEEQRKVIDLVTQKKSIFFTGSAGTGKSFLLQRIIGSLEILNGKQSFVVTATTGIAAVNIGGNTLHSFAGIGYGDQATAEDLVKKIRRQRSKQWIGNWQTISTLIVDEISMLSGQLFDKLEYIARHIRKNNLLFGGLQIILAGDFFQLPPINSNNCFEAKQWKKCLPYTIQLTKIYRQKESELIDLLNEIRFGEISAKSWEVLKSLEREPVFPNDGIKATQLFATNAEVNKINSTELKKLNHSSQTYRAIDWEDKKYSGRLETLTKNCLATGNLELKIGSQVMLIKNLSEKLINGSQGVIIRFQQTLSSKLENKNLPIVKFANGIEKVIAEEEWTDETPIIRLVRARRTQIPLILSWAITIHKSQGQSIERLKIDLSRVFEKGQTYVALSRACSIEYLQVIGFSANKIICDEKVKKFYKNLIVI